MKRGDIQDFSDYGFSIGRPEEHVGDRLAVRTGWELARSHRQLAEQIADQCASGGGTEVWEWPITLFIYDPSGVIVGAYRVHRHMVPEYEAVLL